MSIASRIQEIETHIGDVYDTINYSYDTTGINKNIINIPKYLKKGYVDIINNGIDTLYNNFPKVSGIGSNLSLTPTYEAPMKLNEIDGNTLQDGTPTPDTPVEIQSVTGLQNIEVCGKNLLNIPNGTYSHNGITAVVNNGEITLNGTASGTSFIGINVGLSLNSGNFVLSNNNSKTINDNSTYIRFDSDGNTICTFLAQNVSKAITLSSNTNYSQLVIRTTSGITFNNFIIKPQLEKGSTATTYEPYKSNTYEVNLGKNLFDKTLATANTRVNSNDGTIGTMSGISCSDYINIGGSSSIYLSGNATSQNRTSYQCAFYNSNKEYISGISTTMDTIMANRQINVPSNAKYVIFNFASDDIDTMQLEKGSQATSYSPYFTPIELNKIGDYKDSIKKSTGKNLFDKDNANIFNGYLNGNEGIVSNNNNRITYIQIENDKTYTISKVLSNRFRIGLTNSVPSNNLQINDYSSQDNQTSYTFTNTSYKYLCIWFWTNTDTLTEQQILDSIMIEENNQATSYEPYGKVWYVEKNIGKVVLNGSEGWFNWSNNRMVLATLTDYKKVDSSTTSLLMSNYYKAVSRANSQTNNSMCFYGNSDDSFGIIVCDGTNNTSTLLKAWLSTHNTEVLYVLATPTYTEITNTELIEELEALNTAKSQEGTTNISITSEDLEMILNVSALKGDA